MKLLNTYDDCDDADEAAKKLTGDKRLASERDATVVIYNLFGISSWGNLIFTDWVCTAWLSSKPFWIVAPTGRPLMQPATLKSSAR